MGFLPHRIPPTVFLPHGIPPMVFLLNGIPPLPHLFFSIFFWGVSLSYQSFIRWWEPHLPNFFLIFRRCKSPLTIFFSSFLWGVGFLHQIFFLQVFGGVSGGSLLTNLIFNFFTFFWVVGASAPNYFFLQFFEGCKFPPHIFFFFNFLVGFKSSLPHFFFFQFLGGYKFPKFFFLILFWGGSLSKKLKKKN